MRIQGPTATAAASTASPARRAAVGSFTVSDVGESRPAGTAAPLRTVGGIDALIALQGIEDPRERRNRAIKRGRVALDALDELKIGLLGGDLSPATLAKLRSAAGHLKGASGEADLDGVLDEI